MITPWSIIGVSALLGGAFFTSGCLLGFLFGIPRSEIQTSAVGGTSGEGGTAREEGAAGKEGAAGEENAAGEGGQEGNQSRRFNVILILNKYLIGLLKL